MSPSHLRDKLQTLAGGKEKTLIPLLSASMPFPDCAKAEATVRARAKLPIDCSIAEASKHAE
jgi:hypothetical protein